MLISHVRPLGLTALLMLAAPPAFAQVTSATPMAQPAPAADAPAVTPPSVVSDDDKIVCRSQRFTGSRFPERTCRTRKEWRDRLEDNRRNQERVTERNRPERYRPPVVVG